MYDSVLVGTDGSDDASTAARHAIELARRLEVPLHGVAVVESRTEYDNAIVDPDAVERRLRAEAQTALDAIEALAEDAEVPVVTTIREGVPHEELIAYADEHEVGAIVVGARGRSAFKRILLGSTADAVVRLSPVPVVVVGDDDRVAQPE